MKIKHKGLEHGVTSDAPFIGARLCALHCNRGCPDCQNQYLKDSENIIEQDDLEILLEIQQSNIDQGLILGGLEWTNQPHEMEELIRMCHRHHVPVILYTGMTEEEFFKQFPFIGALNMYVKFGAYRKDLDGYHDEEHDVYLASSNQYIKRFGTIEEE